jgi:hypothetical protein
MYNNRNELAAAPRTHTQDRIEFMPAGDRRNAGAVRIVFDVAWYLEKTLIAAAALDDEGRLDFQPIESALSSVRPMSLALVTSDGRRQFNVRYLAKSEVAEKSVTLQAAA